MKASGRTLQGNQRSTSGGAAAAVWLEHGALFVLLLIVGMRPLLSETYESGEGMFADYVRAAAVTSPATTAGFDVAIWLAAVAVALAGVLTRKLAASPFRWTGLEVGWLVMVVAAGVSTAVAASNKRLALNASVDWLTTGALAMTLVRLCRGRLRTALVLGVIVAAGAASTVRSAVQVGSEYRLTREDYEQNKDKLWRDVPPDDPRRQLYERRLAANEATGFLAYANAEGSLLMLCGFAAAAAGGLTGVRGARWALRGGGVAMVAAVLLTGSKGAILAAGGGAALLLVLHSLRGVLRGRWRMALVGCWATVLIAVAGITGLGLARGGLPGASLAFRWDYWRVTATIIQAHPLAGVGALNFDRAYLQLKPIEFPEEIRDPHNFLLATWAQWGTPGLVGLILAAAGASIAVARRWVRPSVDGVAEIAQATGGREAQKRWVGEVLHAADERYVMRRWVVVVIAGFVLLRLWLMGGMLATETGQASVFVDMVQYVSVWAIAFAVVATASVAEGRRDGVCWRLIVLCGVAAFLLHNTIDFAIFVPGAGTAFAAMVGVMLAESTGEGSGSRVQASGRGSWATVFALGMAVVGLLVTLFFVFGPVNRSVDALARARGLELDLAIGHYDAAAAADLLDPVPLAEMAERIAREPTPERVEAALAALEQAVRRDPLQAGLHRWLAQFHELRHRLGGDVADLRAAIAASRRALELYPQSPEEHVNLAMILARAAAATGSREWADEARGEYEQALELDRIRPGLDEVRRWSVKRRAEVEAAMKALDGADSRPSSVCAGQAGFDRLERVRAHRAQPARDDRLGQRCEFVEPDKRVDFQAGRGEFKVVERDQNLSTARRAVAQDAGDESQDDFGSLRVC